MSGVMDRFGAGISVSCMSLCKDPYAPSRLCSELGGGGALAMAAAMTASISADVGGLEGVSSLSSSASGFVTLSCSGLSILPAQVRLRGTHARRPAVTSAIHHLRSCLGRVTLTWHRWIGRQHAAWGLTGRAMAGTKGTR